MKRGKTVGSSKVTTEMSKAFGLQGVDWMWVLIHKIWKEERMPEEWRKI